MEPDVQQSFRRHVAPVLPRNHNHYQEHLVRRAMCTCHIHRLFFFIEQVFVEVLLVQRYTAAGLSRRYLLHLQLTFVYLHLRHGNFYGKYQAQWTLVKVGSIQTESSIDERCFLGCHFFVLRL